MLRSNEVTLTFTPLVPGQGPQQPINFPGFIESLSDSYSPEWNGQKDIGRADAKYLYGQFQRAINVSFKVVLLSQGDKEFWLDALNSLLALTYPVYREGFGYNGVFVKFKIGNLLASSGYVESLDYTIDNETPWIQGVPTIYNVQLGINVIEDEKPKYKRTSHKPINLTATGYGLGRPN